MGGIYDVGLVPNLYMVQSGYGIGTPFGLLLPPGGRVACYLSSSGGAYWDEPIISGNCVTTLASALARRLGLGRLGHHQAALGDAMLIDLRQQPGTQAGGVGAQCHIGTGFAEHRVFDGLGPFGLVGTRQIGDRMAIDEGFAGLVQRGRERRVAQAQAQIAVDVGDRQIEPVEHRVNEGRLGGGDFEREPPIRRRRIGGVGDRNELGRMSH